MKRISILFLMMICVCVSCKESTRIDYKFTEKDDVFECTEVDMDLIKEAIYAFDDYANKTYNEGRIDLQNAYYNYSGKGFRGRYPSTEKIDDHLKSIVNALKNEDNLWTTIEGERQLNPETILPCIANNAKNTGLGTILNGLISTNSYNKKLFIDALASNTDDYYDDKVITTYFILETFYTKLMLLDLDDPNIAAIVYKKNDSIFRTQRAKYFESVRQDSDGFDGIKIEQEDN